MPSLQPNATETAVLLLVFNRPGTTRHVLEAIRAAQPKRLYVAADGPRPGRPADEALCAETRQLVTDLVDWPCELHTQFRSTNLNCGLGPATAIDWFFSHESEGIILEDDCVPTPAFFRFCHELLARYRTDERVMHIGGNNFAREAQRPPQPGTDSYFFSQQVNSWGWATWRRAWHLYDFQLKLLPELRRRGLLGGLYPSALQRRYWLSKFEQVRATPGTPDIWDYQWHFAVAANGGLTVVPQVNLVRNIGFGADATHTFDSDDDCANVPATELAFPLQHPPVVLRDARRDAHRFREFLLSRLSGKLQRLLSRLVPLSGADPAVPPRSTTPVPALEPVFSTANQPSV
ncbi:nucleotide-diphospho-sugar transferase [Hymenobacter koreensis]|uniref:Hemolytic protein HlpA n=1 Tax=Hymenobacter koreensis TaxID=1084523 RepID=A0ABP8IYP7_9BACT